MTAALASAAADILRIELAAVSIGPPGYPVPVSWPGVPGVANHDLSAEVSSFPMTLTPSTAEEPVGGCAVTPDGDSVVVTLPEQRAVTSLTLTGLARVEDGKDLPITSTAGLGGARLVAALSAAAGDHSTTPRSPSRAWVRAGWLRRG